MLKTKLITMSGSTVMVTTTVESKTRKLVRTGKPYISIEEDFIQFGCMRFTREVAEMMAFLAKSKHRGLVQMGTYKTHDPNTKKLDKSGCIV